MSLELLDLPTTAPSASDVLDALLRETAWTSLDSTYERGLHAGRADAVREHLGILHAAASAHVAARPAERSAVLGFVQRLHRALLGEASEEASPDPFEVEGGLGI